MSSIRFLRSGVQAARPISTPNRIAYNARPFHSTAARMVVHNVRTSGEFKAAIAEHPKVVVDCFATWCGPCKAIAPHLAKLSDDKDMQDAQVHFVKIDVDELPDLSQELGIRAMPTFMFFQGGDKVDEMVGANPPTLEEKLRSFASE